MKAQPIVNDLTTRQWKLYEFLKEQSKFLSRKDILKSVSLYEENGETQSQLRELTRDLQAIKKSERIDKVLITGRTGIKLAQTYQEFKEYDEIEKLELLKRLKLLRKQERKYRSNNQTRVVFGQEKDIVEALNVR